MNESLKIAKLEKKQAQVDSITRLLAEIAKNPVLEIVLGYLLIEACQHIVVDESFKEPTPGMQWTPSFGFLGNLWERGHMEKHYLISDKAGTVAEGGLLVAVALQQGGKDILTSLINAGGNTAVAALGLAGKALPGIAGLIK